MLVISDTSPLIALSQCDKLDLLDLLFDQVFIPVKVFEHIPSGLNDGRSPAAGLRNNFF